MDRRIPLSCAKSCRRYDVRAGFGALLFRADNPFCRILVIGILVQLYMPEVCLDYVMLSAHH